jgi:hypothetical protein
MTVAGSTGSGQDAVVVEVELASAPHRASPEPVGTVACGIAIAVGDVRVHVEVRTDVAYVSALVDAIRSRC